MIEQLSSDVKSAYDNFYANNDVEWRMLGAKYKARNIIDVCSGHIRPNKVLEVGAGDGSILHFLNEWKFADQLFALEIARSGVDIIKSRNLDSLQEAKTFDGYQIPYPDNAFDLVILSHVLEHVEHERILLREIKRVAKHIMVEIPRDYRFGVDKRMKHFLNYGHINMYTPTSLRFLLQSEGLKIVKDKITLIKPEVSRFNAFVNEKKPKSLMNVLKIEIEYRIKIILGNFFGRKKQEQFANAYSVLTEKSESKLQIF